MPVLLRLRHLRWPLAKVVHKKKVVEILEAIEDVARYVTSQLLEFPRLAMQCNIICACVF